VKAAIRLLVRFFLWFVLILLVASALVVAHGYVTGFDPQGASVGAPILDQFAAAGAHVWIPTVLLAGTIALFSAARAMTAPRVAVAALAVAWTGLLLLGGTLLQARPAERAAPVPVLPERSLVRLDDLLVYPLDREGFTLSPIVIHDDRRAPGFSVRPEATIEPSTGSLTIPGFEPPSVDIAATASSYPAMVQPPELLAGLASDVATTAALLALPADASPAALLNLFALAVFLLGNWTLVRLTRWPLFNAVFALAAIRFALWIVPAVQTGALRGMLIAAFDSTVLPYASAIVLAGVGAGLFALLVFLPSLEVWKREVEHG
jgi:hypothetical protein